MSHDNFDAEKGIKTLNEYIIDIIGALVPGILFLFSTIVSLFPPLLIIYYSLLFSKTNPSSIFQGGFWWVVFLTFLVLAYTIGSIFYRLDVKDIDRASFNYEKDSFFLKGMTPIIDGLNLKENPDIKCKFINRMGYILYFNYFNKFPFFRVRVVEAQPEPLDEKVFIEKYCYLLMEHLSDKDRNFFQEEKQKQTFCRRLLKNDTCNQSNNILKVLNTIGYFVYCNKRDSIIELIACNNTASIDENDIWKNLKDYLNDNIKQPEISSHLLSNFRNDENHLKIVRKILKPYIKISEPLNDNDEEQKDENAKLLAIGWYFLFSLRSETACDNEQDCQFPYEHYDKYLIKREEVHLLGHVRRWCNERVRSKNALNRLKLKLKLIAHRDYNIGYLVKNEAHVRMASSSWHVAKKNMVFSAICLGIIFVVILFVSPGPNWYIIAIFPALMLFLNIFIYRSIIKYLHYQRLREVFFVLQVFDEYFGDGCIYQDASKQYMRKCDEKLLLKLQNYRVGYDDDK